MRIQARLLTPEQFDSLTDDPPADRTAVNKLMGTSFTSGVATAKHNLLGFDPAHRATE